MPRQLADRHQGCEMRPVDLRDGIIAQLLILLGGEPIEFESFTLENGPRADVKPAEVTGETPSKRYFVQLKP